MKTLLDEGYRVSAGVLNLLDTDQETARLLEIPTTNEAPFSPITDEPYKANLKMISQADVLVVTPTQFGDGNLRNLEAAEIALENGITTILVEDGPIEERDFTQGKATEYFKRLRNKGATSVKSIKELVQFIDALENKNNKSAQQFNL